MEYREHHWKKATCSWGLKHEKEAVTWSLGENKWENKALTYHRSRKHHAKIWSLCKLPCDQQLLDIYKRPGTKYIIQVELVPFLPLSRQFWTWPLRRVLVSGKQHGSVLLPSQTCSLVCGVGLREGWCPQSGQGVSLLPLAKASSSYRAVQFGFIWVQ